MPEDFNKNFIPKKRVDPKRAGLRIYHTVDTLTAVAVILFSTTVFVVLGLYGSAFVIEKQTRALQSEVSKLSGNFNSLEVSELVFLDKKVSAATQIINRHTSLTDIRNFLKDHTQSKVQVISYIFEETEEDQKKSQTIVIKGEALNYNTLANQQNIFMSNESVQSVVFSAIKPTEIGTIEFIATLNLKETIFSYNILSQ